MCRFQFNLSTIQPLKTRTRRETTDCNRKGWSSFTLECRINSIIFVFYIFNIFRGLTLEYLDLIAIGDITILTIKSVHQKKRWWSRMATTASTSQHVDYNLLRSFNHSTIPFLQSTLIMIFFFVCCCCCWSSLQLYNTYICLYISSSNEQMVEWQSKWTTW